MVPAVAEQFERAASGPITVDITTTGRRSGEAKRIEIWIVKVGDRIIIGGTPGPRDWFANLLADPNLIVHLKDDLVVDVRATAANVTDSEVRVEIWRHLATKWYRGQTPIEDLIAEAPTVELTIH